MTSHRADNDNNPDRITRMVPYNGGCSTTSGKTPVTLPRLGCLGESLDAAVVKRKSDRGRPKKLKIANCNIPQADTASANPQL